jgi:hypothetical protein
MQPDNGVLAAAILIKIAIASLKQIRIQVAVCARAFGFI